MYKVELTLVDSGKPITIYFSNNLTVIPTYHNDGSLIQDGNHNNGGWTVLESYEEVMKQIDSVLKGD